MSADQPTQRLFIGGATSQQSWESLQQRLGLFGKVLTVEHPAPKPTARPFMYVEFAPNSQQDLHKCITTLNGTKWQGATLRIERAQTSYLSKLQTAWEEDAAGGEAAEGGDDDNGIPPATYPLRISRPRKRHKPLLITEQGTGTKTLHFPPAALLPMDRLWGNPDGSGLNPPHSNRMQHLHTTVKTPHSVKAGSSAEHHQHIEHTHDGSATQHPATQHPTTHPTGGTHPYSHTKTMTRQTRTPTLLQTHTTPSTTTSTAVASGMPSGMPHKGTRGPKGGVVQDGAAREAMQDAIRHAMARAAGLVDRGDRGTTRTHGDRMTAMTDGDGGMTVNYAAAGTVGAAAAEAAAGETAVGHRSTKKSATKPKQLQEYVAVADFMSEGEEEEAVGMKSAALGGDLDRFNSSSSDEEGEDEKGERAGKGVPQVDGAADSEEEEGEAGEEEEEDDDETSVSRIEGEEGEDEGEEEGGQAKEQDADSDEDSSMQQTSKPGGKLQEEIARVQPLLWGLPGAMSFCRQDSEDTIRQKWRENRPKWTEEWRSMRKAAVKKQGGRRGKTRRR